MYIPSLDGRQIIQQIARPIYSRTHEIIRSKSGKIALIALAAIGAAAAIASWLSSASPGNPSTFCPASCPNPPLPLDAMSIQLLLWCYDPLQAAVSATATHDAISGDSRCAQICRQISELLLPHTIRLGCVNLSP